MSAFLYIGVDMSFEEKRVWIYLAAVVVVSVVYFVTVFGQRRLGHFIVGEPEGADRVGDPGGLGHG